MSRTALIIVDVQEDFLPGGALGHPKGDLIIPAIIDRAEEVDLVIASRDLHPADHFSFSDKPEFKDGSWPPHCVQGTKGARLNPHIKSIADYIVTKGQDPNPPDAYSAFAGGTLRPLESTEDILKREKIDEVWVVGLLLGWCVSQTAFDANALGYPTSIFLDSTIALPGEEGKAIAALIRAGIDISDGETWI